MKAAGHKIQGFTFNGRTTLQSIGKSIFHFDYRSNIVTGSYSGYDKIVTMGDISPSNIVMQTSSVSSNTRRPVLMSDGWGMPTAAVNISSMTASNALKKLNLIHLGSPHLISFVVDLRDAVGTALYCGGLTGITSGYSFFVDPDDRRITSRVYNDAGTAVVNRVGSVNSVPLDQIIVVTKLYYGSGTGSNNHKIWIDNSLTQYTDNPTFGTATPDQVLHFSSNGTVEYAQKMSIAYDLTGKTTAQCDAFATLFFQTLKEDSEYASLTTP